MSAWTAIRAAVVAAAVGVGSTAHAQTRDFDLAAAVRDAAPGQAVHIPAGTYAGPVVLERPISLIADGRVVIDGGGSGDVLTVRAPDVTLRGLTLQNTGISLDKENAGVTVTAPRVTIEDCTLVDVLFGIYLKEAEDSVIRRNHISSKALALPRRGDGIRLWQSSRCIVEDNVVTQSRDLVMWFSDRVQLRRNVVTGGRYGMHFMYSDGDVLEDNRLEDNSVGAFLMYSHDLTLRRNVLARNRGPSGYGLGLKEVDGLLAEDNLFVGNRVGIHLDNSPSDVDVTHLYRRNVIAYNDIGIAFMPSVTRNNFTENTFLDNIEQVAVLGEGLFAGNRFTLDGRGNYWSDYRGFDLDGDGLGDAEYRAEGLFENLVDREPRLRLFMFSPAQRAVEAAAQAFPIVAPRAKLTDTAPLMSPTHARVAAPAGSGAWSSWALASVLVAAGLGCVAVGGRSWVVGRGEAAGGGS